MNKNEVTVIVPTKDRPIALSSLLWALNSRTWNIYRHIK